MTWLDRIMSWFRRRPLRYESQAGPIAPFSVSELLALHNAARAKVPVAPLHLDSHATAMAVSRAAHAAELNLTREHLHDGFQGVDGATNSGENAEMGAADAASVMAGWMDSAGHRENIRDTRFTAVGFGRSISRDLVTYWYVIFAG